MVLPVMSTEPVNRLHDPLPATLALFGKSSVARELAMTRLPSISSRAHCVPARPRSGTEPDAAVVDGAAVGVGFLSAVQPPSAVHTRRTRLETFRLFFIAIPWTSVRGASILGHARALCKREIFRAAHQVAPFACALLQSQKNRKGDLHGLVARSARNAGLPSLQGARSTACRSERTQMPAMPPRLS